MRTAWLLALVLLAGCFSPGAPPASPDPVVSVDGAAALDLVRDFLANDDGSPRYRVPGTEGHATAAQWLWQAMQVDGWSPHWQNFTGEDYTEHPKGSVQTYAESPGYCSPEERERLGGLSFHNLWAELPSASDTDDTLYLGAHWESKRFANQDPDPALRQEPVLGANDGAAGVGVLLQLMRHVVTHDVALPVNVVVVFFDGEDGFEDCHPLAGSIHFVDSLGPGPDSRFSTRRMLLLDMVGDPAARFVRESQSASCDPVLVDLLHEHAPGVGLAANFPNTTRSVSDDHLPFLEAGIPAVDLIDFGRTGDRTQTISGFPPYWHTTHDTLANLDGAMMGRVGDLVLTVIQDERFLPFPDRC